MMEPTNHPARDEWERMLSGELYVADSPQQQEANMRKRRLVQAINTSEYDAFKERDELFHELFGAFGEGGFVEPPFNCDYGCNTFIGKNCIFLDVARITIGDRVFFGPRVGLYTPYHPIDATVRSSGPEGARPITIGNDVWFGGNVAVLPGVTIGSGAVIGAGSVVSRDVPPNVVSGTIDSSFPSITYSKPISLPVDRLDIVIRSVFPSFITSLNVTTGMASGFTSSIPWPGL